MVKVVKKIQPKRGRGRPRKVKATVTPKVRTDRPKPPVKLGNVSRNEGTKGRKVGVVTEHQPEKAAPSTGSNLERVKGARRSPRLMERSAVT